MTNHTEAPIRKLVVVGPNLPTATETFHVHSAECADRRRPTYRNHQDDWNRPYDYQSKKDVVEDIYQDIIAEDEEFYGGEDGWKALENDFKWFPCVGDLPLEH